MTVYLVRKAICFNRLLDNKIKLIFVHNNVHLVINRFLYKINRKYVKHAEVNVYYVQADFYFTNKILLQILKDNVFIVVLIHILVKLNHQQFAHQITSLL